MLTYMLIQELRTTNPLYPFLLKEIKKPPEPLFVSGTLLEHEPCFTVVGTRKPTSYGIEATRHFVSELARAGFTIVSGLAFGVDAIAHEAALENNCRTIAVLGSGPDIITPTSNEKLGLEIARRGALVSEFPPGTEAQKFSFPQRDRLMAGFSYGTLVIEAGEKSGALITARNATEYGRDVFCVPGQIFSLASQGTNKLIQEGAKLVLCIDDILQEYEHAQFSPPRAPASAIGAEGFSVNEQKILACLTEPKTLDEIIAGVALESSAAQSCITMLELKRAVVRQRDGRYDKKNS